MMTTIFFIIGNVAFLFFLLGFYNKFTIDGFELDFVKMGVTFAISMLGFGFWKIIDILEDLKVEKKKNENKPTVSDKSAVPEED